jgi:HD-GYP domain-containing protein (c-di-GMP phosphodiesterase class II)
VGERVVARGSGVPVGEPEALAFVEVAALLARATDHAFGQPPGTQLRATLLSLWLAREARLGADEVTATFFTALLRFLGCTGHAHEVAVVFGDEIETRARSLVWDQSSPKEALREVLAHGGAPLTGLQRSRAVLAILAGGRSAAAMNFRTGCEVADALAARLSLGEAVRSCLAASFERWNGRGFPRGMKGDAIPVPIRVVHLCQELEVLERVLGRQEGLEEVRRRAGRAYDPALVALLGTVGDELARLEALDPWDAVLEAAPAPHPRGDGPAVLRGDVLDRALETIADFADLTSPFTGGHSRGVADLAAAAVGKAGLPDGQAASVRRGGLVHDLGRVGVPNSVWDKAGVLTRAEIDRVQTHTLHTEQLLRHTSLGGFWIQIASAHHECAEGSGYHKSLANAALEPAARILAAADCYHALGEVRPHREALEPGPAAELLRSLAREGHLDADAVNAVLPQRGMSPPSGRAPCRPG